MAKMAQKVIKDQREKMDIAYPCIMTSMQI
jgi:hypothetical protein